MESIISDNRQICYLCGKYGTTEAHHIFNGTANRSKSEEDGMKVYLHRVCHRWLHEHEMSDLNLKAKAQRIWMEHYGKTEDDFIKRYGVNYIAKLDERLKRNEQIPFEEDSD